ncbi:unnamed protein product [Urochloa humidicola]
MNNVDPLPTAPGSLRYVLVAIEYFSKWVEAEPIPTINSANTVKFFWKNIVCRFGVPRELTVDNGKQFGYDRFASFCESLGTKVCFASIYHPQSNGTCEHANGSIFFALSKRIFGEPKGTWAGELPDILWALRTVEARSTGFSPFRLLFGEEAMTPKEASLQSLRVTEPAPADAEAVSKHLLDETRLMAAANLERYQRETKSWCDKCIKEHAFREGQLVLRRHRNAKALGKFKSKWKGPFVVLASHRPYSYRSMTPDGSEDPHS